MVMPDDYESGFIIRAEAPMLKTWISAVTKPTVDHFCYLADSKYATIATASRWYLIALVLSSVINFILGYVITALQIKDWSDAGYAIAMARENVYVAGGLIIIFAGMQACAIPIGIFITTMVLMFENWMADKVGGAGSFDVFVFVCIAWMSPLAVLSPFFYQIPIVGSYIMGLYYLFQAYLMVITLRAVKKLSVVKSLFVAMIPVLTAVIVVVLYHEISSISR